MASKTDLAEAQLLGFFHANKGFPLKDPIMKAQLGKGKTMSIMNASNFIKDNNFVWNGKKGILLFKIKAINAVIPEGTECYIHGKVEYQPFKLFPFYKRVGLSIESANLIYINGVNPNLIELLN